MAPRARSTAVPAAFRTADDLDATHDPGPDVARARLEEDAQGDYQLQVDLRAALPGVRESEAEHLMHLAHETCPYSKATRGNITVNLSFD